MMSSQHAMPMWVFETQEISTNCDNGVDCVDVGGYTTATRAGGVSAVHTACIDTILPIIIEVPDISVLRFIEASGHFAPVVANQCMDMICALGGEGTATSMSAINNGSIAESMVDDEGRIHDRHRANVVNVASVASTANAANLISLNVDAIIVLFMKHYSATTATMVKLVPNNAPNASRNVFSDSATTNGYFRGGTVAKKIDLELSIIHKKYMFVCVPELKYAQFDDNDADAVIAVIP